MPKAKAGIKLTAGVVVTGSVTDPVGGGIGYLDLSSNVSGCKFMVGGGSEEPIPMDGYMVTSGKMTVSFHCPTGFTAPAQQIGVNPDATVTLKLTFPS